MGAIGGKSRGSSPRMRGTGDDERLRTGQLRFIPAHAGNSCKTCPSSDIAAVHPRACGEQSKIWSSWTISTGSSPRMRGTALDGEDAAKSGRFIPAHAGNSPRLTATVKNWPVHPRACGEQCSTSWSSCRSFGSSPRMRGTGQFKFHFFPWFRFIPAHAGNRSKIWSSSTISTVHPRACGEQGVGSTRSTRKSGSSPRMRGTGAAHGLRRTRVRFIPAHAGNSHGLELETGLMPVHPRACGEQLPGI